MNKRAGFTIVELIIVIVVIAILAVITIVAYNGVSRSAKESAVRSELQAQVDALKVKSLKGGYPESLAAVDLPENSGDFEFFYTRSDDGKDFCYTALYKNELAFHRSEAGSPESGPCNGHSGGTTYCPSSTPVDIDGYLCSRAVGSVADGITKLTLDTSGVPADAPGAFVGRQTNRDAYIGPSFTVAEGETYCVYGWISTKTSPVGHTLGIQYTNSSGGRTWSSFGSSSAANATDEWVEVGTCRVVGAGWVSARVWSQNGAGANTPEAIEPWYNAAVRLWKQ